MISSWTESSAPPDADPARLSRARSWLIAACADVTRLPTSATCWVTSSACWLKEISLAPAARSWVSTGKYCAAGILSCRLICGTARRPGGTVSCSLETSPATPVTRFASAVAAAVTFFTRSVRYAVRMMLWVARASRAAEPPDPAAEKAFPGAAAAARCAAADGRPGAR